MNKLSKIILIVGVILVIGLIIFLLFKYAGRQTQPQAPETPDTSSTFPIPSASDEKMPVKTISGDTIYLNNVYHQPVESLSQNGVAFIENSDYYMAYYPQDQAFIITLLNPDIKTARNNAERDLLKALGIEDEKMSCQLKVSITVPYGVNADASGQEYGLSFCPGGKPFN
jgi:hypothetical protein